MTGYDYIFYSPISSKKFFKRFRKLIKTSIWSNYIENYECDQKTDHIMAYFQKDQAMDLFGNQHGYALNAEGEGPFAIFTSKKKHSVQSLARDLKSTIDHIEYDSTDYEPCPTVYIYTQTFCYTLVLPANIDDSPFTKLIHQTVYKCLLEKKMARFDRKAK